MRTTLCFLPQAASAHGEAFAAGAQCRFQNGTMFGLGGARMALGALLQQTHQFIIEIADQNDAAFFGTLTSTQRAGLTGLLQSLTAHARTVTSDNEKERAP